MISFCSIIRCKDYYLLQITQCKQHIELMIEHK